MEEIMNKTQKGRRGAAALRAFAAALLAALILVMPVAAATITGDDVVIRNSPEDKGQANSIGSLNTGDTVTVLDSATDAGGTEWYLVQLPNKNQGYVKAQWVDNGGETVKKNEQEETAKQEETAQEDTDREDTAQEDNAQEDAAQAQDAGQEEAGADDASQEEGLDDWTEEDPEMLAMQEEDEKAGQADENTGDDSESASGKRAERHPIPRMPPMWNPAIPTILTQIPRPITAFISSRKMTGPVNGISTITIPTPG